MPPFKRKRTAFSRQLVSAHDGYSTLRLPDVGDLRLLKHTVSIPGKNRLEIGRQLGAQPLAGVGNRRRGRAPARQSLMLRGVWRGRSSSLAS